MSRAPGERYSYRVEENDAGGRFRAWLVVQASNMGDGAFVVADADTSEDAHFIRQALARVEDAPPPTFADLFAESLRTVRGQ